MPVIEYNVKFLEEGVISGFEKIQKTIEGTAESADHLSEKSAEAGGKVKTNWTEIGVVIGAAGVAIATAGIAIEATLFEMAEKTAHLGTQMDLLSQRTGLSTEALGGLGYAAQTQGVSIDNVTTGLRLLASHMEDAQTKGGAAADTFGKLGVTFSDMGGQLRPTNEVLFDVADRFLHMANGAEKSALAVELFGRGGLAMIPILNQGRDALEQQAAEAERLGIVFSEEAAKRSHEFEDAILRLHLSLDGLTYAIGQQAYPILQQWAGKITDIIVDTKDWINQNPHLASTLLETATVLIGSGGLLVGLGSVIALLPKAIEYLGAFGTVAAEGTGFLGSLGEGVAIVTSLFDGVAEAAAIAAAALGALYIGKLISDWTGFSAVIRDLIDAWKEYAGAVVTAGEDLAHIAWQEIRDGAIGVRDAIVSLTHSFSDLTGIDMNTLKADGEIILTYLEKPFTDATTVVKALTGAIKQYTDQGPPPSLMPNVPDPKILQDIANQMKAAADAARLLSEEQKKLMDSFNASLKPADDLNKTLDQLHALGVSNAEILDVYGQQIIKASNQQLEFGIPLKGTTAALYDQASALIGAQKAYDDFNGSIAALEKSMYSAAGQMPVLETEMRRMIATGSDSTTVLKYLGDGLEKAAQQYTDLGLPIPDDVQKILALKHSMEEMAAATKIAGDALKVVGDWRPPQIVLPIIAPPEVTAPLEIYNATALKSVQAMEAMQNRASMLGPAFNQLRDQGYTNAQAQAMLAQELDWAAKAARDLGIQLDPATMALIRQREATAAAAAEAKHWSDVWANNFASVTSGFTDALSQVIFHGKSFGSAFADLGKSLAESFFKSFTSELLSPVTSAMAELGRSAAQALSGVLTGSSGAGGGSSGGGGLLGSIIGALPGIGGGGGATPAGLAYSGFSEAGSAGLSPSQIVGAGGSAAGGAAGAASFGSTLAAGAASAGIGIAASYGLQIAMDWYKNLPHFKQNELVHNIQTPFDQSFSNIIGAVTDGLNNGTLTVSDAQLADDHMYTMWAATSAAVNNWAAGDSNKTKALTGFHATEDNFVRGWLDWIDSIAIGLGGHKGSIYSFDVGTPFVDRDQLAYIHRGEMITPAANNPYNPANQGRGSGGSGAGNVTLQFGDINVSGGQNDDPESYAEKIVDRIMQMARYNQRGFGDFLRQQGARARV